MVLLLVIGFFFTNNMTMMLSPEEWMRYFSEPGGLLLNLAEPTLMPRFLHFVLSAVAVGGLFLALMWELKRRDHKRRYQARIRHALRWFTWATLLQFVIGTWWLLTLPTPLSAYSWAETIGNTFLCLGMLGTISYPWFSLSNTGSGCVHGATMLTILCMVLMRDQMRTAFLKPYFEPSTLETHPQYGSLVLFILVTRHRRCRHCLHAQTGLWK